MQGSGIRALQATGRTWEMQPIYGHLNQPGAASTKVGGTESVRQSFKTLLKHSKELDQERANC